MPVPRHVLSTFFFVLFIDFRREVVVSFVDIDGNNDLQYTISVHIIDILIGRPSNALGPNLW